MAGGRMVRGRRAAGLAAGGVGTLGLAATAGAAQWVKLDKLSGQRYGVAATTAPNGEVWAIGGASIHVLPTVEIYDAAANHWRKGPAVPNRSDNCFVEDWLC